MKNFNLNINGVVVVNYDDVIYKCSIQDISEEGFSISVPVNDGKFLMLDEGKNLDIEYCTETGNYYEFDVEVIGRDKSDKIPMYKLSLPMNVRKIQRRNYVRVPVVKNVEYRRNEEELWSKATILDLSGGGMKIKAAQEFKINEKLFIKIETISEVFEITAEVKRSDKIKTYEYIYGLEFIDINENKRDKIVKEVFLIMRKQREII